MCIQSHQTSEISFHYPAPGILHMSSTTWTNSSKVINFYLFEHNVSAIGNFRLSRFYWGFTGHLYIFSRKQNHSQTFLFFRYFYLEAVIMTHRPLRQFRDDKVLIRRTLVWMNELPEITSTWKYSEFYEHFHIELHVVTPTHQTRLGSCITIPNVKTDIFLEKIPYPTTVFRHKIFGLAKQGKE